MNRKSFVEFLGKGTLATAFLPNFPISSLSAPKETFFNTVAPSSADELVLAKGYSFDLIASWGDPISKQDTFGYNNDYIAFLPSKNNPDEGILWVNHESVHPLFVSGWNGAGAKTKEQYEKEMYAVGGSIFAIQKKYGKWKIQLENPVNGRITAKTMIPFLWDTPIANKRQAMGTLANCSGGITPWGTILTCEENYDYFYGERNHSTGKVAFPSSYYQWDQYKDNPPEHYGWVVEVNPISKKAHKLVALGRCAHECATMKVLSDGRVVVYSGDDANDECLYKFVSSKPGSLQEGTLYVANLELGKWLPIDFSSQQVLQQNFSDQTEVLIQLRKAAKLLGGTPLDRPEDIEIDPVTGNVLIALTNNKPTDNYHGSILKIEEMGPEWDALSFKQETFITGGADMGFSCPDNLAFDAHGNLWFTTDISGSSIGKAPYTSFKNNGLFVVPRNGQQEGKVLQIASAPNDAEFTGPYFAPNGDLFLSVQHPGELTRSLDTMTSNWPNRDLPKPSIVCIQGL